MECRSANKGAYVYIGNDQWLCINCKWGTEESIMLVREMKDAVPVKAPLGYKHNNICGRIFFEESAGEAYADMIYERLGVL